MKAYKIPNKKINNVGRKNIVSLKREPKIFNKYTHFGEKVQETNNYILYASGNQKSYYEFFPQETQFKSTSKNKQNKLYNNKSFSNFGNKKIKYPRYIYDDFEKEKILNSSDNYGYKETYNIKSNDPNLRPLTIHNIAENPKITETMKIINNNVRVWKREFNKYSERNQGIRVIKENQNKSYDNIIKRKTKKNYRIKINNEYKPNNHKSKVVKITKINPGEYKEIYQKKYVKKNENYMDNIEPCYLSKYSKKSQEQPLIYINKENRNNNNNKYFINNDYESNLFEYNNLNKTFGYNKIICEDEQSKCIECPLHGNISIVIHKNPFKGKRKNNLYQK